MELHHTLLRLNHQDISPLYPFLTLLCLWFLFFCWKSKSDQSYSNEAKTVPYRNPFFKSTIGFAFYGPSFFLRLKLFQRYSGALRVRLVTEDIYIVHGPKYVTEIFQNPNLSVTKAYAYALQYCFGMHPKAAAAYHNDTSGSRTKPIMGSYVKPTGRIGYSTHENLVDCLLKSGLEPTTTQFETALFQYLQLCNLNEEWVYYDDIAKFFENLLGQAILKALFGPLLLEANEHFVEDLFEYDKVVMNLARRVPWFINPKPYRLRKKIVESIKRWHSAAKLVSDSVTASASDADSAWGSSIMKDRHEMLMNSEGQDEDSVASTDFGLIWASVTNVVPSTLTMAVHTFSDPQILLEVRKALEEQSCHATSLNMDYLEKIPILLSLYAETLRFGVQIHIPRDAPHHDVQVGNTTLPQTSIIFLNTWLAHSDDNIWNTQNGRHPLNTFWPYRFLVYPSDSSSGPCKTASKETPQMNETEAKFSAEGLQGSWIPYGSGHHACPGRLLAKRIMLKSVATLAMSYDIEILSYEQPPKFDSPRFGFGVMKPAKVTPFRIRKRSVPSTNSFR
ncbi:cytochrome P450 [Lindgomyces ingoldianus]|uniref:Cytochrome P450 n=1 Tax=Lindgomyces ingoldianus TaxID=673940 RepID=A0ACB6QWD3_9PLEO|nr:cytochrome P450 [Lindgomyces ingoldianus]KAF2470377.1 cytochrome P450 [Lindgomyces ingoldianus]